MQAYPECKQTVHFHEFFFFIENSILPSLHSQDMTSLSDPGRVKQRVFGPQGFGSQGF